jgi:anti-sigma28 factor (negative regulator of flagellin synthesis)
MIDVSFISGSALPATLRDYFNQALRRHQGGDEAATAIDDRVEISELAAVLGRMAELPEHDARRIVEIRSAIEQGAYLTADKLDAAIDGLLRDL